MCTHRHINGASADSSMGLWHKASRASPLAELAQLAFSGWLAYSPTALPATYGKYTQKWPDRVLHGAKMGILPLFFGCVVHENAHFM